MEPEKVLPLWVRVDLGVMAMKVYSTYLRAPELEPHHQMQFSVIPRTLTEHCLTWGLLCVKLILVFLFNYNSKHPNQIYNFFS